MAISNNCSVQVLCFQRAQRQMQCVSNLLCFQGASKSNSKTRKVGEDASLLSLNLCVSSFVFPAFSVFKVVYHEHPFVFSVMPVMP